MCATASVEMLAQQHPRKYAIRVKGTATEVFDHNPHVQGFEGEPDIEVKMSNPLINECDKRPCHFLESYCETLRRALQIPLSLTVNRPFIYLSEQERQWKGRVEEVVGVRMKYWLVNAGTKRDYTTKGWSAASFQAVVDAFQGRVQFVQIGAKEHDHPPLRGVIDQIGKTNHRELIRLVGHEDCQGVLTGESYPHHLAAAFGKPCVTLCSGFLPPSWIWYPTATILSHGAAMPCCQGKGACWKSRVRPLNDGDGKDKSLCLLPVLGDDAVAKCMAMISPESVIEAIQAYYWSGKLSY